MIRTLTWLLLAACIASCAAQAPPPEPDRPGCVKPEKGPVDGGMGGTGHEDDPCPPAKGVDDAART